MIVNIHASCIVLGDAGARLDAPDDAGILLLGPSGAGKSDLALRLIAAGGALVADDRTDLSVENGALVAAPPASLAGLIEVRNLGIVPMPHVAQAHIALAVMLVREEIAARMPEAERWAPPDTLGLARSAHPPLIRLNPFEISATAKVAVAAALVAHSASGKAPAPI